MTSNLVTIRAKSDFKISANLFKPNNQNNKVVQINCGTGIPQKLYFNFAKYLAENGFTVITFDYRGVGISKPDSLKKLLLVIVWGSISRANGKQLQNRQTVFDCIFHRVLERLR